MHQTLAKGPGAIIAVLGLWLSLLTTGGSLQAGGSTEAAAGGSLRMLAVAEAALQASVEARGGEEEPGSGPDPVPDLVSHPTSSPADHAALAPLGWRTSTALAPAPFSGFNVRAPPLA